MTGQGAPARPVADGANLRMSGLLLLALALAVTAMHSVLIDVSWWFAAFGVMLVVFVAVMMRGTRRQIVLGGHIETQDDALRPLRRGDDEVAQDRAPTDDFRDGPRIGRDCRLDDRHAEPLVLGRDNQHVGACIGRCHGGIRCIRRRRTSSPTAG